MYQNCISLKVKYVKRNAVSILKPQYFVILEVRKITEVLERFFLPNPISMVNQYSRVASYCIEF